MSFSINDRVKVTDIKDIYYELVVRIIDTKNYDYYIVLLNNGQRGQYCNNQLQGVSPSFDSLLVGDIVIDNDGCERKVLEVGVNSFLCSTSENLDFAGNWLTFAEAKELDWKVKGQEEAPKEMTVKEISEKLGYKVKDMKKDFITRAIEEFREKFVGEITKKGNVIRSDTDLVKIIEIENFIKSKLRQAQAQAVKEFVGKIDWKKYKLPYQVLLFTMTECPKCGYELNQKWVEEQFKIAIDKALADIQAQIKKLMEEK